MRTYTAIFFVCILFLGQFSCGGYSTNNSHSVPVTVKDLSISGTIEEKKSIFLGERFIGQRNLIVYNNSIIIFGGLYSKKENSYLQSNADRNDLVISSDGKEWYSIMDEVISPERYAYSIGMLEHKIIVYGGVDYNKAEMGPVEERGDMLLISPFLSKPSTVVSNLIKRKYPALSEFKDAIFVIGGFSGHQSVNTVIKIQGNTISAESKILGLEESSIGNDQAWVYHDELYVTDSNGGFWKSRDGLVWEKIVVEQGFMPRKGYSLIVRGDDWYLAGGVYYLGEDRSGLCNDVWKSSDAGKHWTLLTTDLDTEAVPVVGVGEFGHYRNSFPARQFAAGFVFKGQLMLGGGFVSKLDGDHNLQDFWASDDGKTWKKLK